MKQDELSELGITLKLSNKDDKQSFQLFTKTPRSRGSDEQFLEI